MKKIIPKINLDKKDIKRILFKMIYFKRLLFMLLFGALLIFTFDTIYKYTFLNIKYIDYVEDNSFIITDGKITNVSLSRILKNIDEDKRRIEIGIKKEHKNPFEFGSVESFGGFDYEIKYENENDDKNEDENIDKEDLDDSENLGDDESSESSSADSSGL